MIKGNLKFLVLATFLAVGCKKDDDSNVSNPIIEMVTLNGVEDHVHVEPGDTLNAHIEIIDDEALSSAKVEIHAGGDHTHRVAVEFTYDTIITLSGKEADIHLPILIPATTETGEYHFTVQALDAEGNESTQKVMDFEVETH